MKNLNDHHSINSGTPWEDSFGYSRAIRMGNVIEVAGTTAFEGGISHAPGDAYAQTHHILNQIAGFLEELGGSIDSVVRTRIFVTDISRWKDVGRAHAEFFRLIRPASTLVEVSRLIEPDLCLEIEATAYLHDKS